MKLEGGMYHDIKVHASFGRHLSYDLCHSCFLRNNIILFVEISFYLDLISLSLEIISFSGENSILFGKKTLFSRDPRISLWWYKNGHSLVIFGPIDPIFLLMKVKTYINIGTSVIVT